MNHEELLEVLNQPLNKVYANRYLQVEFLQSALRAVVELHKPPVIQNGKKIWINNDCVACSHNNPCPTLNAIEKELK